MADVSVVVSTFNRAHLLDGALAALTAQRHRDLCFEVIAVDNNSTDHTAQVLRAWAAKCPLVKCAHESRQGVSWGRNLGASLATAPILAFTDDDVRVAPEWVATMKQTFDSNASAAFAGGRVTPVWPRTPPAWLTREHWGPLGLLDYGDQPFRIGAHRPLCLLSANLAVRREVFESVGRFAPPFLRCQDHELLVRLWRSGFSGLYDPRMEVMAIVPEHRLAKQYHLMWHRRNGSYHAMMAPADVFWTLDSTSKPIMACDVPAFTVRQLAAALVRILPAYITPGGRDAFSYRVRSTYFWHYIRRRYREYSRRVGRGLVSETAIASIALARKKVASRGRSL